MGIKKVHWFLFFFPFVKSPSLATCIIYTLNRMQFFIMSPPLSYLFLTVFPIYVNSNIYISVEQNHPNFIPSMNIKGEKEVFIAEQIIGKRLEEKSWVWLSLSLIAVPSRGQLPRQPMNKEMSEKVTSAGQELLVPLKLRWNVGVLPQTSQCPGPQ